MILYRDTSVLVKFYVDETGSTEVQQAYRSAEQAATAVISRAEISAGLAKAHRMGLVPRHNARRALDLFHREWPQLASFTNQVKVALRS